MGKDGSRSHSRGFRQSQSVQKKQGELQGIARLDHLKDNMRFDSIGGGLYYPSSSAFPHLHLIVDGQSSGHYRLNLVQVSLRPLRDGEPNVHRKVFMNGSWRRDQFDSLKKLKLPNEATPEEFIREIVRVFGQTTGLPPHLQPKKN